MLVDNNSDALDSNSVARFFGVSFSFGRKINTTSASVSAKTHSKIIGMVLVSAESKKEHFWSASTLKIYYIYQG